MKDQLYNSDESSHGENTKDCFDKKSLKIESPVFPHYSSYEDRLSSFDGWPATTKLKPQILSEAGFFYLGRNDQTICFYCGGGLNEWKPNDDPWNEHAFWFRQCNYVLSTKGKEYVDNALLRKLQLISSKENNELHETPSNSPKNEYSEMNTPVKSQLQTIDPNNSMDTEQTESSLLCKICFTGYKKILFFPCKHLIACSECSSKLSKCAVCREPIKDTIKVYY